MARVNSYIGAPVERVEDFRFLRGRGEYLGDVVREGLWHAAIFRSPVAHARIRSVDVSAALARPGVHAVMTGKDIPHPLPTIPLRIPNAERHPGAPYQQPVIAADVVRYVGEPIAVVLASSPELAEDALEGIVADLETLPIQIQAPHRSEEVLLFPETGSNCAAVYTISRGDAEKAFANAEYRRREEFRVERQTALPMETRGLMAEWDGSADKLIVHGAAKAAFQNRKALARMLRLPEETVDLIECDVGGGFGVRGDFYCEDFLIPFAAWHYKRPIKWIEDRREHFLSINHARDMSCSLEIACRQNGEIVGLRGETWVDIGAYAHPSVMNGVRIVAQFMAGPYRVPHIHITSHALLSNKTPSGVYRGPGRFESSFFFERMLDLVAADLKLDRVELRRRNLIRIDEMPYALATSIPDDGLAPTSCDSGDYAAALETCLEEFGWKEKLNLNGAKIDGRYHGIAVGCFIEGGGAGPRENARILVEADGRICVHVGSSAIGQGIETVFAQIAADALEVPIERIRVLHGSTTLLDEGFGSYASRATVMGGSAILDAAKNLLTRLRTAASVRLGAPAESLIMQDGLALTPGGESVAWQDLPIEHRSANGTFASSRSTYAYGSAAAHVSVDAKTGHVALLDYVVVDDVGRAVNPLTLHGQMLGATVQGLGGVFSERLVYDDNGQLLIGSLADYLVPLATDYPNIRAISTELHPSPHNPLGTKGAGEGGIIPPGGVIANAVSAALSSFGVHVNRLPIPPEIVWEMVQEARSTT